MAHITLLYTGDIHGHVENYLRAAYLIEVERYELNSVGRHVIVLDSGDVEERSLLESDLTKGAAMFRLLKLTGYDASAVGNGAALTYGPQVLQHIARASELPLLCANILRRGADPVTLAGTSPTLILKRGPIKIGLIGVTAEMDRIYEHVYPVRMLDVAQTVRQHASELRQQGCHLVGVLSHLGYDDDVNLAQSVPNLAFIIGGHSHTILQKPVEVNGTIICHAGDLAQYVGRLDLLLGHDGQILNWYGRLLPVPDDGPVHTLSLNEWNAIQEEVQNQLTVPVGYLNASADLAYDRACGMGQLLADALRNRMHADAALCITGHLRDSLDTGDITLGDLLRVTISPANATEAKLTGDQILYALEYAADPEVWQQTPRVMRNIPIGILQVSGITYSIDHEAPYGERVSDVRIMGEPVNPDLTYRIAATDYEFSPRRGYVPDLDPSTVTMDVPWVIREILEQHVRQFNPLTPGLRPRILIKNS
jgi:2',3'-cyclic-nucleotide 2'-phosphodiesterase (5'-nucleotidase family)